MSYGQQQCIMFRPVSHSPAFYQTSYRHLVRSVNMGKINEDLQRERNRCTFNIEELTNFKDGSPEKTKLRKQREKMVHDIAEFYEGTPEEYLGHKEKYEDAIKKHVPFFNLVRKLDKKGESLLAQYSDHIIAMMASTPSRDGTPLGGHWVVFMPAILSQGTEEQLDYWLQRASDCSVIGTFAQTELGHGTFIRGLETTATYDPETKEFVLHSPTLTSYKWWPGGLGHTANYSVIMAQLYIKGKCYGVHAFIVQVRDEETHMPLPGIKVGDIGAKMGINVMNNGFLGFDHVRIPRNYMLMKHAQVLEDGTYVKSVHSKLIYGSMVFVRVVIVFDMANHFAKAATIATRYSAVRRQGQIKAGEPEAPIMDYLMQMHKLFVGISASYAFRITATKLWDTFHDINNQLIGGNLERLPELHAISCCLKAISTADAASYVERCRLACGGHGYMQSSNLPFTYGLVTAACTYEGDNTVLLLQTARFLVKTWQQIDSITLTPTVAYLKTAATDCSPWRNTVEGIIRGFEIVAMGKISSCVNSMKARAAAGASLEDAWNLTSVQLVAAAEAHCRVFILTTYYEEAYRRAAQVSPELRVMIHQLVEVYAVYWALEKLSDLLRFTSITSQDLENLQSWYEELLLKIRPNAVGLVDAFDIPDKILQSTLGAYDGRVYERLMEEALKSPLNQQPVNDSFHKYLKPFMRGKL
ncbi:probable peroxisomal acyl-coenzyme A oxidase 1 [Pectinophora gossypiella]|uniref:probable peroxisomal acyl-coenzyme A oxidase 1 n=1 Tax=Pectinophora gossypiella TaxID=13191 RepID=UPI00214EBA91|nr:probable peroxisomal acyl-coenzyme A oxidase 1 [Pectinophora gossypiella]